MRIKKFKSAIDYISFHEYIQIHKDRKTYILQNFKPNDGPVINRSNVRMEKEINNEHIESKDKFEYPLTFLVIMHYLFGIKLNYE